MPLTAEVTPLEENRVRLDVAVPEDEVQRRMERADPPARARRPRPRVPAGQGAGRGHRPARRPRRRRAGDAQGLAGRVVLARPSPRPASCRSTTPTSTWRGARRGRPHLQGHGPGAAQGDARRVPGPRGRQGRGRGARGRARRSSSSALRERAARLAAGRAAGRDRRLPDHRLRRRASAASRCAAPRPATTWSSWAAAAWCRSSRSTSSGMSAGEHASPSRSTYDDDRRARRAARARPWTTRSP